MFTISRRLAGLDALHRVESLPGVSIICFRTPLLESCGAPSPQRPRAPQRWRQDYCLGGTEKTFRLLCPRLGLRCCCIWASATSSFALTSEHRPALALGATDRSGCPS